MKTRKEARRAHARIDELRAEMHRLNDALEAHGILHVERSAEDGRWYFYTHPAPAFVRRAKPKVAKKAAKARPAAKRVRKAAKAAKTTKRG